MVYSVYIHVYIYVVNMKVIFLMSKHNIITSVFDVTIMG